MRISDWSSDVCSSDLPLVACSDRLASRKYPVAVNRNQKTASTLGDSDWVMQPVNPKGENKPLIYMGAAAAARPLRGQPTPPKVSRSEEHTSELQSLMRNSYAVFCLKKKNKKTSTNKDHQKNY